MNSDGAMTQQRKDVFVEMARRANFPQEQCHFGTAFEDRVHGGFTKTWPQLAWGHIRVVPVGARTLAVDAREAIRHYEVTGREQLPPIRKRSSQGELSSALSYVLPMCPVFRKHWRKRRIP